MYAIGFLGSNATFGASGGCKKKRKKKKKGGQISVSFVCVRALTVYQQSYLCKASTSTMRTQEAFSY
jgi:hypothetical protein